MRNIKRNNNQNFLKKIEKLNEREKQIELYKYAKLLTINKNPNIASEPLTYYIKFRWPEEEEGIKIINDTLELTLENLEDELFKELDNYFELNKFLVVNRDTSRIEFLITQRQIAKELNIQKNQIIIYPLLDIPVTISQNVIITFVFFIASVLRGYLVRRYFNKKE